MATETVLAPAKINLALHVTGQRSDGYHTLDSYVAFADFGDVMRVSRANTMSLSVSGPFAQGVPTDAGNLCWRAAERFGVPVEIELKKNLPAAAGIGGGSSDAAAVIRALERLAGHPAPFDPIVLGADVPVCMVAHAAHMQGIGDWVLPLQMDPLPAVLVNPRVALATSDVFAALAHKENPAMTPWPEGGGAPAALSWLAQQRNDLEAPARRLCPAVDQVLAALGATGGCELARMSGSGATCFGLYDRPEAAAAAAAELAASHPDWWIKDCLLS